MSLFSRRTSGMELRFRVGTCAGQKLTSPVSSSTASQMPKGKHKYHVYTLQREKGVGGIPGTRYRYRAGVFLPVQ